MSLLYVKAAPGMKLPKEGEPRKYITDTEAVPVQSSHYYYKAIDDGDLIRLTDKQVTALRVPVATSGAQVDAGDK